MERSGADGGIVWCKLAVVAHCECPFVHLQIPLSLDSKIIVTYS